MDIFRLYKTRLKKNFVKSVLCEEVKYKFKFFFIFTEENYEYA